MATKTVINCMEHSIAQPNQGVSILIDQYTPTGDQLEKQQVCDASSNSNIINIKHSNEQSLSDNLTLNNKTLIDINRGNDDDHHRNELVLQINCSPPSSEISREIISLLSNGRADTLKLECNGILTERGNAHNDVQCKTEKPIGLAKDNNEEEKHILTKYPTQTAVAKDGEESGQTASQQQQQQQQQHQKEHQQQQEEEEKEHVNGNITIRENGQKSAMQLKLKLNNHNDEEQIDGVEEKQLYNFANDYDNYNDYDTTTRDHNVAPHREDNNEVIGSSSGISDWCLVQREVSDLSHGKRLANEENSNSLLTQADATTCTKSSTLLTIKATANKVTAPEDLNNFENFTNDKTINHVVKIQIKPNNKINTLTEKQITVVKIENLQVIENETAKQNSNKNNNHNNGNDKNIEVVLTSENIIEKEKEEENTHSQQTSVIEAQIDNAKMVQKPSNNSAATVTVVSNSNNNGNGLSSSGTVTAVTTATGTSVTELNVSSPNNYLYYMMSSGQFSPCDTLDSGTGSDLESNGQQQNASPNLQMKKSPNYSMSSNASTTSIAPLELHLKTTKILVPNSGNSLEMQQRQCSSLTDSEESEASSLSCDSLHSNEFLRQSSSSPIQIKSSTAHGSKKKTQSFLPDSLLREIKNLKFSSTDYEAENEEEDDVLPTLKTEYEPLHNQDYIKSHEFIQSRKNLNNLPPNISSSLKRASLPSKTFVLNADDGTFIDMKMNSIPRTYEADKYYNFHVNEHDNFRTFGNNASDGVNGLDSLSTSDYDTKSLQDDVFAGYKDLRCGSNTSTIRSSKGTVRGVKNRVRNGIATFLQLQQPNIKNYKEKDSGKVVLYTTSMGIIRDTYAKCSNVKQILRTLLVKFEERDVFMSVEYQQEIRERMHSDIIKVPQLYVEGQHIGDADTVERLNESGELRLLLKPYKSISTTYTCQTCGGYRLLPCPSCNGSKKSVHRNHFTAEFVALKCMNCDEVGLVKCHNC